MNKRNYVISVCVQCEKDTEALSIGQALAELVANKTNDRPDLSFAEVGPPGQRSFSVSGVGGVLIHKDCTKKR